MKQPGVQQVAAHSRAAVPTAEAGGEDNVAVEVFRLEPRPGSEPSGG